MRNIGDGEKKFPLRGVQSGDALVRLLDTFGDLFHFGDERIGVLLILLEAGNLFAGLVALGFKLLGRGDEFAALLVERAKSV